VGTSLQARRFAKTAVAWFVAVGLASGAGFAAEDGRWGRAALALAGAVAAGALAAWAFRSEAARAAGPADSPERRARRLSPVETRVRLGVALAVGVAFALALHVMPGTGDDPTAPAFVNRTLFMTAIYGAYMLWQGWAAAPRDVAGDTAAPGPA
jgi:hypothetical protein